MEKRKNIIYVRDITDHIENTSVSFVNRIDSAYLESVEYVSNNIEGPGSRTDDFETVFEGCKCTDECTTECSCMKYGFNFDKNGLLLHSKNTQQSLPIIECSSSCSCQNTCYNRVAQKGLRFSLQVFNTGVKDFGVRTLQSIPKFSFVCEYAGEVIGREEAQKRIKDQKEYNNYIFVLREHTKDGDVLETIIDPTYSGNVGRYLNHSCDPNLFMVPVRTDCMVPKLCLFASRDIEKYEELCYDYSGQMESFRNKTGSDIVPNQYVLVEDGKPCYCDSEICFGVLPYDPLLFN